MAARLPLLHVPSGCVPRGSLPAGSQSLPPQPSTPGPTASPEQLSFRERQKYFELEVRVPQTEGPPKRVSLVGADDLRKMQEEEGEPVGGQQAGLPRGRRLSLTRAPPHPDPQPESCSRRGRRCCRRQPLRGAPRTEKTLRRRKSRRRSRPGLAQALAQGEGVRGWHLVSPQASSSHWCPTYLALLSCPLVQALPHVPSAPRGRQRPCADSQS